MTLQNFLVALDKTIEMYGGDGPNTPTFFKPGCTILVTDVHNLLKQIRAQAETLPCAEQGGIAAEIRKQHNNFKPYNAATFFKDAVKHNFVIKIKDLSFHMHINEWLDDGWYTPASSKLKDWSFMLSDFVWADDNTPCGVLTDDSE